MQFTQEDPIGLAGGMNLYAYGAGDPINNRDPFGLSPETTTERDPDDIPLVVAMVAKVSGLDAEAVMRGLQSKEGLTLATGASMELGGGAITAEVGNVLRLSGSKITGSGFSGKNDKGEVIKFGLEIDFRRDGQATRATLKPNVGSRVYEFGNGMSAAPTSCSEGMGMLRKNCL